MNRQFEIQPAPNKNFDYTYNRAYRSENRKTIFSGAQEFTKEDLPQQDDTFFKFLDFIQKHYSDDQLNLGVLAQAMYMSKMQLYRKVKQFVNQSPINFLRAYRLQKSIELLANTDVLSISEIAYRVGFSDPNYFSRVFSTTFDQTPSEYRKKNYQRTLINSNFEIYS